MVRENRLADLKAFCCDCVAAIVVVWEEFGGTLLKEVAALLSDASFFLELLCDNLENCEVKGGFPVLICLRADWVLYREREESFGRKKCSLVVLPFVFRGYLGGLCLKQFCDLINRSIPLFACVYHIRVRGDGVLLSRLQ